MKAIVCKEFGPPEKLVFEEFPTRALGPTDVRIAVECAGVNFPDGLVIQNKYQRRQTPPFVPGGEVSGRIVEVGEQVKEWKAGDQVAAICRFGGFAEEVVIGAGRCVRLPPSMSAAEGAGYPFVYGTGLYALQQRGRLQPGETLLVLGAAGGVGLAAVQLGKIMGARVIAAASSPEKLALCREHGADMTVDYSKESLKDAVKNLTDGRGADVIYDPVGGSLAQDCFSCINWNGRYLVIGFADGQIPEIALNRLLLKGSSAVGVSWGTFIERELEAQAENMAQLARWYEEGRFKPYVSKQYRLQDGAQAIRDIMDRKVTGKVVLVA